MNRKQIQEELSKLSHASGQTEVESSAQFEVLQSYVQQQVGVVLKLSEADTLLRYFNLSSALAVQVQSAEKHRVCAIFTSGFGESATLDAERFLYWQQMKDQVPEYEQQRLPVLLSATDFFELSLYHELFHCLDPYYGVKQDHGHSDFETQENFEKFEAFAEVGALLYLAAKKSRTDLVQSRLLYRIVGSFMVGRYGNQLLGPNPYPHLDFSVIYSFYPALLETQAILQNGISSELSLAEIIELAGAVVEQTAFTREQSYAISRHQKDPEGLNKLIQAFKKDSNEMLRQRFISVEVYRDQYQDMVDWAFNKLFRPD